MRVWWIFYDCNLPFSLAQAQYLPLLCRRHSAEDPAQPHEGQHPSKCCSLISVSFSPSLKDFPVPMFLLEKLAGVYHSSNHGKFSVSLLVCFLLETFQLALFTLTHTDICQLGSQRNLTGISSTGQSCSKGHYCSPSFSAIPYAQTQLFTYHTPMWLLLHCARFSTTDFQEAISQLSNHDSQRNKVPHLAPFNR